MADQPPSNRRRDPERTRADLLAVATEVFAADGYSGARVDEIAERTATTKRMIYYYFGGKEQLYRAVLEAAYAKIRRAEQSIDVSDLGPVEAVRRLAELTYDHHCANPDFIRLVAIENIHRGQHLRQLPTIQQMGTPALSLLERILELGWEREVFRRDVDAHDVHLVISSYCVFQVANQHTFGVLFDRDLQADDQRRHLRSLVGSLVVSWLTDRG